MSSLLQQLENNEAVLLMYLADELPAEDRAEVEQMLATDAGMRAALESLRDVTRRVDEGLAAADRGPLLDPLQPAAGDGADTAGADGEAVAADPLDQVERELLALSDAAATAGAGTFDLFTDTMAGGDPDGELDEIH